MTLSFSLSIFYLKNHRALAMGIILILSLAISGCGMKFYEPNESSTEETATVVASNTRTQTIAQITKEWTHVVKAQSFLGNLSFDAISSQIAINSTGQAIIVWKQSNGVVQVIFKAERDTNGTWLLPTSLADSISSTMQSASSPQVAMNDAGQAIITWYQSDGTSDQVFKAERATNGTWSIPLDLADNISASGQDCYEPQVALNSAGQAIITWTQYDGTYDQIFLAERDANGTWIVPADLNDNISPGTSAVSPQLAMNDLGQTIIAWDGFDGLNSQTYKAERAINGTWTIPANLADNISPDGQNTSSVQTELNNSGQAVISWDQFDGLHYQIYKAERASNGTWTLPANLTDVISVTGQNAESPEVALNDSGQAIISWYQNNGTVYQVFKAERASNGTWTVPANLADNLSPDGQNVSLPQVAINDSGQAIISWYQNNGTVYQVFKAERATNGSWQIPANLADNISPGGTDAITPHVSMNDSGQAIITWQQIDGTVYDTFKAERSTSGSWELPVSLDEHISTDGQDVSSPQIALNNSGQVLVTWLQKYSSKWQVFKSERAASGTWTLPVNLADNISPDGQDAFAPQIAMNDSGQAIIIWYQADGTNYQIFKAERASNGSWTQPSNLSDNISPNAANAESPQIAMNELGQAIITWLQDGATYQIFKAERDVNGTWTLPANLSDNISPDGTHSSPPAVAMNDSGRAIITWAQRDGTNFQIFKSERASNGTWTVPANLADNISLDGQDAGGPEIAINASGEAVVSWSQGDGLKSQIYKAERSANATWTLPANLADNISPDTQDAFLNGLELNDSGQVLLAWIQNDGSNDQVYIAQRATTGVWTLPINLADNISPNGTNVSSAQIAMNDSGQAIITWQQYEGNNLQIYKSERATNEIWTHPTTGIFTNQEPWPFGNLAPTVKINGSAEILIGYGTSTYGTVVSTYR